MDDARDIEPGPESGVHEFIDLDPTYGQHNEINYTGRWIDRRYHIQERIGGGGMADVYRARDQRLYCDVAVKFLKPRLASEQWCARMYQEARASAAIDHPHLLRVTDVGRVGPTIYIVMELLHGASLEAVLRGQPGRRLPWRRVLELLLPVAGAFQAAHDRGFIHRDIKPDNLFLRRGDHTERLIVLDLGIVKRMTSGALGDASPATATGYLLGTPPYMSPEQAVSAPLDERTDIYSLGVTLYRAITGRLPFLGRPGEPLVVLAQHLHETPPPFAKVITEPLDCPAEVEQLVMLAINKRPEARPASMRALAEAMRACLERSPAPTMALSQPRIPPTSASLRSFGRLSVAATLIAALAGWPALGEDVGAAPMRLQDGDELAITITPTSVWQPDRPARPSPAEPAGPPTVSQERLRQLRARLRGSAPEVERCLHEHGDPDASELSVTVALAVDGRVSAAHGVDPDADLLSACVQQALGTLRLVPGAAVKLRHRFQFTSGNRP